MFKAYLIMMVLCVTVPPSSCAIGPESCGALDDVCQDRKTSLPATTDPTVQLQAPEVSALAPMPVEKEPSKNILSRVRTMAARSRDKELFTVPDKTEAPLNPFGIETAKPLQVAPSQNP